MFRLAANKPKVRRTLVLQDYGHVNRIVVSPNSKRIAIAGNPHVRLYDIEGRGNEDGWLVCLLGCLFGFGGVLF